jgi:type IV secretion system protein TrbF
MAANPYVGAWKEWDDRYADHVLSKRNWQLAAAASMVVSTILAVGMVWQASRSHYVVYAVQVDKLGYALTVPQPLTAERGIDTLERIKRHEVAAFIRDVRSVSSDPQAEQERLDAMHAHTRGAADHFLADYFHSDPSHNPFVLGEKETVSVQLDSVLSLSPKTYEVRWSEQARDLNGAAMGVATRWEAELETEIVPPSEGDTIVSNPIGFYVDRINWTEEQE